MRLSKIKLAGFKSFVDPTIIHFRSNLLGIVGPNGCGKSNVIDAVRWVMGESSAKHLRGDSMADVIFNGSSSRKPVGTASIELIFDNSDGQIGGQYSGYAEIAIRRVVSRDGTSIYSLNGTRCRRKDITGIFLGTGLGTRGYSIIEQGMISRLVDAKPDELRVYLEEAAGISKYKERRRETENRIGHTRENLRRLNDLREEIEKHLNHLQRQARTAKRYKFIKQEHRQTQAELLALKLRDLEHQLAEKETVLAERERAVSDARAHQQEFDRNIESARVEHGKGTDHFNDVQGRYFKVGAEIARLEQAIEHGEELRQRRQAGLRQTRQDISEILEQVQQDERQMELLTQTLTSLSPGLEDAQQAEVSAGKDLRSGEVAIAAWQEQWETHSEALSEARRRTDVERTRIEHVSENKDTLATRLATLRGEERQLPPVPDRDGLHGLVARDQAARDALAHDEAALRETTKSYKAVRPQHEKVRAGLDKLRDRQREQRGKLASLETLQQAALGETDDTVTAWLKGENLAGYPRLAHQLSVEPGWERAVETVLGSYLEAVCVPGIDAVAGRLGALGGGSVAFVEMRATDLAQHGPNSLASKVKGPIGTGTLLSRVRIADSISKAMNLRSDLRDGESVVTRDGIWLGADWLRVCREADESAGVIKREQAIRDLKSALAELEPKIVELETADETLKKRGEALEIEREEKLAKVNAAHRSYAEVHAKLETAKSQRDELRRRHTSVAAEIRDLDQRLTAADAQIREARETLEHALEDIARLESQTVGLEQRRDALRERLSTVQREAETHRTAVREIAVKVEAQRSTRNAAGEGLRRMQENLQKLRSRQEQLNAELGEGDEPLAQQGRDLELQKAQGVKVEKALSQARRAVEEAENSVRELEQQRMSHEATLSDVREALETVRLAAQEIRVRRDTVQEQFAETNFELDELMEHLLDETTVTDWEEKVARCDVRLQRMGAINLAAIDEFEEEQERKDYLDAQYQDLTEALDTLENAIRKIDRETRSRFKETFENVNHRLREIFPRLFGGGQAYLELTGDDMLTAGVAVMARPPGKRNSTIHLLSGGEKALTAVALVFSIFMLNPAPFCLLDEVDAPLDDANVARFCEIVGDMSDKIQFVIITHNKITMEMANQLIGVTMNEPGVSRLVAVDVDEAVKLAAV